MWPGLSPGSLRRLPAQHRGIPRGRVCGAYRGGVYRGGVYRRGVYRGSVYRHGGVFRRGGVYRRRKTKPVYAA